MYKVGDNKFLKHVDFIIISELSLIVSFLISIILKNGSLDCLKQPLYEGIFFVMVIIDILTILFFDLYSNVLRRGYLKEFIACFYEVIINLVLISSYMVLTKSNNDFSRSVLYVTYIVDFVLSYTIKISYKHFIFSKKDFNHKESLLLIAKKKNLKDVKMFLKENVLYRIVGIIIIDENYEKNMFEGVEIIENSTNVVEKIAKMWVDEVLFFKGASNKELIRELSLTGIPIHICIDELSYLGEQKQFVEIINGSNVLTSTIKTITIQQMFIKRLIDILGGIVGCLITIVIAIVIGPIIYFSDKGPIFYQQERIGKNGKVFKMYKFRSMYINADEQKKKLQSQNSIKDGMMFKIEKDPRVIKGIGEFIRKTSIDEFPQFINILKGDMSLVGTRPPTIDEWEKYKYHHRARMSIKPGLTGLWQVSGRSNITDFEEVVKLDCEYITNWSFSLDIKILFKTIKVVFTKEGSM